MNKLKTFWYVFKKSISSFSYYRVIPKTKFSFSLKYLFFLLLIVSLLSSIRFSLIVGKALPKIPDFINKVQEDAKNFYPKELIVKVVNGEVSTNVKEPYYLDLKEVKDSHFITIDTKAKAEDLGKYNTLILITKTSIVTKDKETSYRIYPLNQLNKENEKLNVTINKRAYDAVVAKLLPYLKYLGPLAIGLIIFSILVWPLLGASFSLSWKLFYLLFIAAIVWVVAKIMRKKLAFSKIYQMSMHAVTIPVIIGLVFTLAGLTTPFLIPSIILIIFLSIVVREF